MFWKGIFLKVVSASNLLKGIFFFFPIDSTAGGPPGARGSIRVQYPVASVDQEGNVSGGEMFIGGHGD